MKTLKIQFVFNNCDSWTTIPEKVAAVKAFYASQFDLQIDVLMTSFAYIPFSGIVGSDGSSGVETTIKTGAVDPVWYDENITAHALGYDMVLFYIPTPDITAHIYPTGVKTDVDQGPVELTLFGINETYHAYQFGVDLGNTFVVFACHEIAHGLYALFGGVDNTHKYFYSTNPSAILNDFNFSQPVYLMGKINRLKRAVAFLKSLFMKDQPSFPQKIINWAHAIETEEGAQSYLNNPGNLKYSSLTASWGAMPGRVATDGGSIAKFPTYDKGFAALCNFLILGCENQLLAFHQARTLGAFSKVYAGNPPQGYIDAIAQALGVSVDTDISTLIQ